MYPQIPKLKAESPTTNRKERSPRYCKSDPSYINLTLNFSVPHRSTQNLPR